MRARVLLMALSASVAATHATAADCTYLLRRLIPLLQAQCGAGQYCADLEAAKSEASQHCGSSFESPSEANQSGGGQDPASVIQPTTPRATTKSRQKATVVRPEEIVSSFCDCSRRRGTCAATAKFIDKGARIEFTSNTEKCSMIGYYLDEHPGTTTITEGLGHTDHLINPLRKQRNLPELPTLRVESCDICPKMGEKP